MSDNYAKIDCIFICLTGAAVCIDVNGDKHWIPRSCIHGADEIRLRDCDEGDELCLRVFEWKLEQEDLL